MWKGTEWESWETIKLIPQYDCQECEYVSIDSTTIAKHIKQKHTDLEITFPQKCKVCYYKSTFNDDLKQYLAKHYESLGSS